ncbi:hypothetical protein PCASD_03676 [Puccinia coronata f. sp. avenae]|uniref:CCHC-type domain-containing protein n=1 Tax=Puccinia coronata f. sp. avenae TaxID=200324 RepID=A0A2N5V9Q7_9BASI|nr:hypothetical protein PCASD_03676 [Puccinia coronata f. sp. avenae]
MCLLLREYERVAKSSHYKAQSAQSFPSFRSGFHSNNHAHHHRQSSMVSHIPKNNGPAPMDLDAMDVSKARCYNCNKIGHLSKDCPSPRKIKFKNDKTQSRPMLNLIDLDIPDGEKDEGKELFYIATDAEKYVSNSLNKIKCNMEKKFDESIAKLNQHLWNTIEREQQSHDLCKKIKSSLNPRAIHFVPGADRHGITRELELSCVETEKQKKQKPVDELDGSSKKLKSSEANYSHNMKGCGLERAAFCQQARFQPPTTSATAPVFASKYRKFSRARILSWPFFTLRSWDPHQMIPGVKIG